MWQPKWNLRFLARNRVATRTFREQKQQQSRVFLRLSFNVYTDIDNRERARARDENKGDLFCWKNNVIFLFGVEKMRNASGQQGEASKVKMIGSERKANRNTSWTKSSVNTYDIFLPIKCVTRKFHVVVVQNNGKEMYKKVCCTCKVVFCYWLDYQFFCSSRCRPRLASLDLSFCLSKL